jgi:hypothetical protein
LEAQGVDQVRAVDVYRLKLRAVGEPTIIKRCKHIRPFAGAPDNAKLGRASKRRGLGTMGARWRGRRATNFERREDDA